MFSFRSAALNRDGSQVAIGDQNGAVDVLNTDVTPEGPSFVNGLSVRSPVARFTGHGSIISAIAFGAHDELAVAAGNRIFLWTSSHPEEPVAVLADHSEYVADLAFSADGSTLASVGADNEVFIWDLDARSMSEAICADVQTPLSPANWQRYLPDQQPEPVC
jgi:WD40 repeat protein